MANAMIAETPEKQQKSLLVGIRWALFSAQRPDQEILLLRVVERKSDV